jgi:uncharacterized protein YfiM (DUF2279 family)
MRAAALAGAVWLAVGVPAAAQSVPDYCSRPAARTQARILAGTGAVAANAGLYLVLKDAWWSGVPAERFRYNYDWNDEWRAQDKFGHAWGGYHLTRLGTSVANAACISRKSAAVAAWVYSNALQYQIEVFDATQQEYGFSPPDILFNLMGSSWALGQEFVPALRHVTPTFQYWPSQAMMRVIEGKANNPFLHPTIDYGGQTYWLSFDVDSLAPKSVAKWWPGILRVSAGMGITDWIDPAGAVFRIRAQQRVLLSLDLDLSKLPGSHPAWMAVKRQLKYVHIFGPTIQLTPRVDAFLLGR